MLRNPKMLLVTGVTGALMACGIGLTSADAMTSTVKKADTHERKVDLKTKDSLVAVTPGDQKLIDKFLKSAVGFSGLRQYAKLGDFETARKDLKNFFSVPARKPIDDRSSSGKLVFIVKLAEEVTVVARNTSSFPGNPATIEIQDNSGSSVALAKVRYLSVLPSGTSLSSSPQAQGSAQKSEQSELNQVQQQQIQQAQMQIEGSNYNEAVASTSAFIESNPQLAIGYFLRGFAYMGLEDVNSAIADLEKSASSFESEGKPEKAAEAREIVQEIQEAQF
jgi:tetratricopeptide (TPR) repeat protein